MVLDSRLEMITDDIQELTNTFPSTWAVGALVLGNTFTRTTNQSRAYAYTLKYHSGTCIESLSN